MAVNGSKKVGVNLDMSTGAKLKNLPQAATAGEAVEYAQLNSALSLKQNSMAGGSGIELDGVSIKINLSENGTDYSQLSVSSSPVAPLNGVYTRAPFRGHASNVGLALDWTHNAGDYAMFYKDNGGGVYSVIVARDQDGDSDTYGSIQQWMAVLTSVNPATLSDDLANFVPNYSVAGYHVLGYGDDMDEAGALVPSASSPFVDYSTGSGSSYLKFNSDELQADVVTSMASAATGRLVDSNTIKTYVSEQATISRTAANNTFSNATAALDNNPSNVQSAIEEAAAAIQDNDSDITDLQSADVAHVSRLVATESALGVSALDSDLGTWSGNSTAIFANDITVKAALDTVATTFVANTANVGQVLGLTAGDTDFGTGFIILSNDAPAKTLFQEIEVELQNLSQGVGQFWSPVEAKSEVNLVLSSPSTDEFGGVQVAQGDRVLVAAQSNATQNGIYIFDTPSTAMVRTTDADLDTEFSLNKTVQVLASDQDGVSGATFAYTGVDDPELGVAAISFAMKAQGVIGDSSVTSAKLSDAMNAEIDAKSDKYSETVTLVAGTPVQITHGLASMDVIVQVRDTAGNVTDVEVDILDSSFVTINSLYSGDYRIVVIG